ncbi:MAG: hypothetical protein WA364_25035 [Candidatus Nitrosopolaris sp.]
MWEFLEHSETGYTEKRIANDIMHNISRDIVNQAIKVTIIVFSDIKHLRRLNRIHEEESLTESWQAFNITS